jgi:hypothetical protein
MEKTEASLVPGWLKVASGNNLSIPHSGFFQGTDHLPFVLVLLWM